MFKITNIINHFGIVIDESYSMYRHRDSVIKVVDGLTAHLAETSKDLNQETRISVWAFNSRGTERCLVWDIDVLRMPSIAGMYNPDGRTALIDCTLLAVNDFKTVPQKYGDHSFVLYVITDGQENDSRQRYTLNPSYVESLGDRWTLAVFVPDATGVSYARTYGFPIDNISVWNPNSVTGVEKVGEVIRTTSTKLMQNRKIGIRSTKNLFTLKEVSANEIKSNLMPLSFNNYEFYDVPSDCRIDEFVTAKKHRPYVIGEAYYQLMKAETIQPQKKIAVRTNNGVVYIGNAARSLLGLPDETVKVKPSLISDYTVFVQSTSNNRKLLTGTHVLVINQFV